MGLVVLFDLEHEALNVALAVVKALAEQRRKLEAEQTPRSAASASMPVRSARGCRWLMNGSPVLGSQARRFARPPAGEFRAADERRSLVLGSTGRTSLFFGMCLYCTVHGPGAISIAVG